MEIVTEAKVTLNWGRLFKQTERIHDIEKITIHITVSKITRPLILLLLVFIISLII